MYESVITDIRPEKWVFKTHSIQTKSFYKWKNTKPNVANCKNSEIKKAATEKEVTVQYKPGQILKLKTVPQVQLFFWFSVSYLP